MAATKVYFTTDGTKPDPFQTGRTGKASTHKYIGPFRLQLGNRVIRAICVSRDRLRSSQVATKYIDVVLAPKDHPFQQPLALQSHYEMYSDNDNDYYDESEDDDDNDYDGNIEEAPPRIRRRRNSKKSTSKNGSGNVFPLPLADAANDGAVTGSMEAGPINPVNYSGTQINVWGFPGPELANLLQQQPPAPPPQPQLGFLTDQMIKVCVVLFFIGENEF